MEVFEPEAAALEDALVETPFAPPAEDEDEPPFALAAVEAPSSPSASSVDAAPDTFEDAPAEVALLAEALEYAELEADESFCPPTPKALKAKKARQTATMSAARRAKVVRLLPANFAKIYPLVMKTNSNSH